ncbi:MAG: hypothetical protein KC419_27155 [Anaerolineales bacterium]|nr:hypothetical protein [Anaerolineales bacterium]
MKPVIFDSKKATVAVIAALTTFLLNVLPIFLPNVPVEIWQQTADLIMKIAIAYLSVQGTVDVVKAFRGQ